MEQSVETTTRDDASVDEVKIEWAKPTYATNEGLELLASEAERIARELRRMKT